MSIGNTKDQGNKGNNFPYQLGTLKLLGAISSSVALGATEATLQLVLSAIQDGQDYEAKLIQDANGDTFLEVRIWNPDTQTWETPLYYKAGDNTPYTIGSPGGPVAPIVYINPSSILAQIKAVLDNIYLDTTSLAAEDFATETTLSGIKTQTDLLSFDPIGLNIRALDCATDEVAICSDGTPVGAANPLPVSASILFPSSLAVTQDPSSNPWVVSAAALDIRTLTFATDKVDVSGSNVNAIVTATALDIRPLLFGTDSVTAYQGGAPWDVSGSSVSVSNLPLIQDVNILSAITLDVSGSNINATQSGTWDINNISGTVSLPTGAATEATLSTISGTASSILSGLSGLNQETTQLLIKTNTDNLDVLLSTRASETTLQSVVDNVTSKIERIKGAANYSRAFTYYASTNNVATITHTGSTFSGTETITETFTYVNNLVDGSNVVSIIYGP